MACLASSNSRGLPVTPEIVPVVPGTTAVTPAAIAPAAIAPATIAPAAIAPAYAEMKIGPFGSEGGGIGIDGDAGVFEIDLGDGGANFAEAIGDAGDVVVGFGRGRRRFGRRCGERGGDTQNARGKKNCKCL